MLLVSPMIPLLLLCGPRAASAAGPGGPTGFGVSVTLPAAQGESLTVLLETGDGQETVLLMDDGQTPDMLAGDGIYMGHHFHAPEGDVAVTVQTPAGQVLWAQTVTVAASDATQILDVVLDGAAGSYTVKEIMPPPANLAGAPPTAGTAPPLLSPSGGDGAAVVPPGVLPPGALPPGAGGSRATGGLLPVVGAGAAGLLLGGVGALVVARRRRKAPLAWVGEGRPAEAPADLPDLLGQRQVWTVPDEAAVGPAVAGLAERIAGFAVVLVVPRPQGRSELAGRLAGRPGICWPTKDRPEPRDLFPLAASLQVAGPVVLLVEGPDALDAPLKDEGPGAVVDELLAEAPAWLSVLVLASAAWTGEARPSRTLVRLPDGLGPEGGPTLIPLPQ
ncbi:hypothetical protein L6R53_17615 [Myxococcota bacterium]|nr:hypothetical protein [Myxococcota bacterium]